MVNKPCFTCLECSCNVCVSFEQKRYSLQAAPPKKDPRSKGVNPSAVQALLKKQTCESKKKGNAKFRWITVRRRVHCPLIIQLSIFLFFRNPNEEKEGGTTSKESGVEIGP